MKTKRSSYVFVTVCLAALLIVSMFVAGCTSNGTTASPAATQTPAAAAATQVAAATAAPVVTTTTVPTTAAQPQSISVSGSTTVLPIAQAAADAYMKNCTRKQTSRYPVADRVSVSQQSVQKPLISG